MTNSENSTGHGQMRVLIRMQYFKALEQEAISQEKKFKYLIHPKNPWIHESTLLNIQKQSLLGKYKKYASKFQE